MRCERKPWRRKESIPLEGKTIAFGTAMRCPTASLLAARWSLHKLRLANSEPRRVQPSLAIVAIIT